jgi:hypothetical protein
MPSTAAQYPLINDPDMATLNRLQLGYDFHLAAAPDAPAGNRLSSAT